MEYIKDPKMIEVRSFEIIQGIIDDIRPGYKFKNEIEEKIIKRCIHTSADFEYLDILKISETAVQKIIDALNNKCTIYTDTNMALSGINKTRLNILGNSFLYWIFFPIVIIVAKTTDIIAIIIFFFVNFSLSL